VHILKLWNPAVYSVFTYLHSITTHSPVGEGRDDIKKGETERDHKPSSVIPILLFSGNREDGHLSRALIAQGLKRPYPPRLSSARDGGKFEWALLSLAWERGLFGLAPGGVYQATPIAQGTGELLPHLFTLIPIFIGTVYFLWHFPYSRTLPCRLRGQSVLRTTLPCGARTFLPS
jgi:hypothetical protein